MPLSLAFVPVLLERRVARVDAVVAELARKSGRDLRARRDLDDEAVFVALGPHSADEAMALLARATSARWARDGATEWLERPADLRRRQAREDAAAYAAETARRFAALLDSTDATPWAAGSDHATPAARPSRDPNATMTIEGMMREEGRTLALRPAGRLLSRLVRAVTPAQMAAVAPNHWGDLSPRPGRWQMPLLGATPASLRQYVEERNGLVASLSRLTPERAGAARQALMMLWKADKTLDRPPEAHLRFHRGAGGDAKFELLVRDEKGRIVDSTSLWVAEPGAGAARALPGYAEWASRSVPMGPRSVALVRSMREGMRDSPLAPLALDPVRNEPLALFLGEPMDELAKAVGGEMVCALPDEAGYGAGSQLQVNPKLGEVADGLAGSVEFETRGGVTVGRARYPSASLRMKASRAALRGFLAEARRGVPRLAAVARYALAQGEDVGASMLEGMAFAAAGLADRVENVGLFVESRDLLRAYGALSPAQQAALAAGTPILVAEMSPAARGCLETLLFTRDVVLDPPRSSASAGVCAPWTLDGLDPAATLACPEPKRETVVEAPNGNGTMTFHEAGALGYVRWGQRRGEFLDPSYPVVERASFVAGTRTKLEVELRVAPTLTYSSSLLDLDLDLAARGMPYAELPPEVLRDAQKTYDYYEKLGLGSRP